MGPRGTWLGRGTERYSETHELKDPTVGDTTGHDREGSDGRRYPRTHDPTVGGITGLDREESDGRRYPRTHGPTVGGTPEHMIRW